LVRSSGFYPQVHPMHYWQLVGTLPYFFPVGPAAPAVDGMGPMVEVTFRCSLNPRYVADIGSELTTRDASIRATRRRYEDTLKSLSAEHREKARIALVTREDLKMQELLFDRGGVYNDGQPMWEASYWPLNGELKSEGGQITGIYCETRHDPVHRYGSRGWRCTSGMRLSPEVAVTIDIYVAHLRHMPAIYQQVKNLFAQSKQS
jgi:hypothetical protein